LLKAFTVIATGKVQAVGLRRKAQQLARQYGLVGSIANLPDGNVKIIVQGDDSKIESFLGSIRLLPTPIKIENLEKSELQIDPNLKFFAVNHGDVGEEIDEAFGAGLEQLMLLGDGLTTFRRETNENFQTLAGRYDVISETLAKVVQQTAESNNELKKSMDTLVGRLDALTDIAKTYFEKRLERE
jgi:acylphosphatase